MLPMRASEWTGITKHVLSTLDVTLPISRPTKTADGFGHTTTSYSVVASVPMNLKNASATQLQTYAGLIGSSRAMVIRVMNNANIQQGDTLPYDGLTWLIQAEMNASSYTVTKEFMIVAIQ